MSIPANKASEITSVSASGELRKKPFLVSRHMLCDLLAAYDLIAIVLSGLAARYIYLIAYKSVESPILEYASLILVTSIFFQFAARQNRLYDAAKVEDFLSQLNTMIYVCAATFAMTFIMLFFMKQSEFYSRVWFIYWSAIFLASARLGRVVFTRQVRRLARKGALPRSIALIGEGPLFVRVKEQLLNDKQHYRLTDVIELLDQSYAQEQDSLQRFIEGARANDVADVLIALPSSRAASLNAVVRHMQTLPADIHLLPDLGDIQIPLMRLHRTGDFSFITTV